MLNSHLGRLNSFLIWIPEHFLATFSPPEHVESIQSYLSVSIYYWHLGFLRFTVRFTRSIYFRNLYDVTFVINDTIGRKETRGNSAHDNTRGVYSKHHFEFNPRFPATGPPPAGQPGVSHRRCFVEG